MVAILAFCSGVAAGLLIGTYLWDRFSGARAESLRRYRECTQELTRNMKLYQEALRERARIRAEFMQMFGEFADKDNN